MNILAYLLIIAGALGLASIGYDEYRGATQAPSDGSAMILPGLINNQSEAENFHNAIVCHCYYAAALLSLGVLMLAVDKSMDKSDPESPNFAGNEALDDWAKAMKEVEEKQWLHKK